MTKKKGELKVTKNDKDQIIDFKGYAEDLKDIDKLLSLMKTISKHKVNYSEAYKNLPMKHKTEIEIVQGDLSKVFQYLSILKRENQQHLYIHQKHVNDAFDVCIDLSTKMQNIKRALIYSENLKK